jgi:hypothetical protein
MYAQRQWQRMCRLCYSQCFAGQSGLRTYDSLLIVPIYFAVWTIFSVIGGAVYFDELSGFSTESKALVSKARMQPSVLRVC